MDTTTLLWLLVGLAALAVVALVASGLVQRRRAAALQSRYGSEYFRLVHEHHGNTRRAEAALLEREKRVKHLTIRTLTPEEQQRFATGWAKAQARFVDDPMGAVTEADQLVTSLMQARGYPMADFETRAADLSVDHPRVVEHYRAARQIAGKNYSGQANTEELRRSLVHYRVLFGELLETPTAPPPARITPQV